MGRCEGILGKGLPSFLEAFPVFGFAFVWKAFFAGMEHHHPRGNFSSIPVLGLAVERSTLYAELPGSSPTFRAFFMSFNTSFCRFNCMAF